MYRFYISIPLSILLSYIIIGNINGFDAWGIELVSGIVGWLSGTGVAMTWESIESIISINKRFKRLYPNE